MAAPVVYRDVAPGADLHGQLFAGKKFWVAQRVSSRQRYLDLIRSNGGEIVLLERKADYLIADHASIHCPPGSISYTFIDESVEKGELQDPEGHRAGPSEGTARAPGSLSRPAKGTRVAYTPEEDRILYKWVHDSGKAGGLASGNEIYKQLEKKHPRHTWQSWRDRYVKTLRNRPPSAFNIPDNAPPSPPSDAPMNPAPASVRTPSSRPTSVKPATEPRKSNSSRHVNSVDYTVDELTAPGLFEKADWEMLYAFAPDINSWRGDDYRQGWTDCAAGKTQTAGQWRQYFEKIVWPQWQEDSDEKHAVIKERVEKRQEEEDGRKTSQTSQTSQQGTPSKSDQLQAGPSSLDSKAPTTKRKRTELDIDAFELYLSEYRKGKASSTYVLFARDMVWDLWNQRPELDNTGLHTILLSQWNALSSEEKAPYFAKEAADSRRASKETVTLSSQVFLSSSTVVNDTPKYISEAYQKSLQQLRADWDTGDPSSDARDGSIYPAKRQKNEPRHMGTVHDPVEVSPTGTDSQPLTQDELPDARPTAQPTDDGDDFDVGGLDAIAPPQDAPDQGASNHASDSPTPRAARFKAPEFDTQAILSSPSQGASLNPLPLPAHLTQLGEADAEDSGVKLASDASTTESLQEFSQMINESTHYRGTTPLPPPQHSSPPQSPASIASSTGSGDPDPPLAPDEVDEYFEEQHAEGFPDEFIAAALKHTRWRPELATEVLQAWKLRQPLPSKRGIWSDSDDEEVEGGDGLALARLENKHTLDGWGGVTERMNFLSRYRSAKE
ncbi:uncharacterized protein CC84DRAFT_1169025 [Paraphaeosphaeria sporulosa]|uniref:DNA-binding protein RAP1 n=1 Tax=Paraphaeosphaeria sporulosa TaxID=1460663 RepID=A0A177C0N9_9PLEO|nr:uncharacterized protein CC84DRAFT_1169025 [Paraphaeosphaeria sporulosa]OAG00180.1 hypothetical protein CC84DRAFT_1169025 [Paraphaeosphaeria sporulosa]